VFGAAFIGRYHSSPSWSWYSDLTKAYGSVLPPMRTTVSDYYG